MTQLVCHPRTPSDAVVGVEVDVQRLHDGALHFRYVLRGDLTRIVLPQPAPPRHTDELWRHTCFEAFVTSADGSAYVECNFSPSGAWATYRFARYRKQMTAIEPVLVPRIEASMRDNALVLDAQLRLAQFADKPLRFGITAVIEERDGRMSYWALRHPTAKPDFHHRAGFILRLDHSMEP